MRPLKPDDTLSFDQLDALNPPSQAEGVLLPYFAPKGMEVFRCGINLFPRYSDLKTVCSRRVTPEKGCLCVCDDKKGYNGSASSGASNTLEADNHVGGGCVEQYIESFVFC